MQAHLARVFGERDAGRRLDALQASMPANFTFTAAGPAVGHHGLARLDWLAGPPDGPTAMTGTDVAHLEGGRIKALHVFLDPIDR